jgi:hypothetical protein
MFRKLSIFTLITAGLVFLFFTGSLFASDDVIEMKNKAYKKHTKSIVMFTHKIHYTDYGVDCGACHHDENGEPLKLKEGDSVASCIDCHSIPSRKPRAKKGAPKMSKSERLEYHAEAIHYNCIGCHKDVKRKNKAANAPTSCKTCHPKS